MILTSNYEQDIPEINSFIYGVERNEKTQGLKSLGFLAGAAGIEPATNGFGDRYSTN